MRNDGNMKKMLCFTLTLVICLTLCACGCACKSSCSSEDITTETTEPSIEEEIIGIWEWVTPSERGPLNGVTHLELYEGGTGKGTNSIMTGGAYYPVTWIIKGNVINIYASNTPAVGVKFEDGKLVAVDGTFTYTRVDS